MGICFHGVSSFSVAEVAIYWSSPSVDLFPCLGSVPLRCSAGWGTLSEGTRWSLRLSGPENTVRFGQSGNADFSHRVHILPSLLACIVALVES